MYGVYQKKIVVAKIILGDLLLPTTNNIVILTNKMSYFLSINTHQHIFKVLSERHLDPIRYMPLIFVII